MIDVDTVDRFKDGHLVKHYLLASYCYYQQNISPMTDHAFDRLCVRLLERWDHIDPKVYHHKNLINKGDVEAGTCLLKESAYPSIISVHAFEYERLCRTRQILTELEPHLLPATQQVPASQRPPRIVRRPVAPAASVTPSVAPAPARPARIMRTPKG